MQLYGLTMYDMTEEYQESFFIGIFSSFEKAEQVAKTMLKEVSGFKDYPCRYEISEKNMVDDAGEVRKVNMIWGWDEDEFYNSVHIIESDLYRNRNKAEAELQTLQEKYARQEWCIDQYEIDDVHWKEGFVKVWD